MTLRLVTLLALTALLRASAHRIRREGRILQDQGGGSSISKDTRTQQPHTDQASATAYWVRVNVSGPSNAARAPEPDVCFDRKKIVWASGEDGLVYANEEPFLVKGITYFGCEGKPRTFTGLNLTTMDMVLDWVVRLKFNTVRIPVSVDFALSNETRMPEPRSVKGEYKKKSMWQLLDIFMDKLEDRGLMAILDMHSTSTLGKSELWYGQGFTEADVNEAWARLLNRYGDRWHLMGVDLKNEPHGKAEWAGNDSRSSVNDWYERMIANITSEHPEYKGLFLVEGVQYTNPADPGQDMPNMYWWGENFNGAKEAPIAHSRVVYSPHVYGPSVWDQPYFKGAAWRSQTVRVWDEQLGWLVPILQRGVIIGEWGGSLNGQDHAVQELLAQWMVQHCMMNNIWWAVNPESKDTGGVMSDDWKRYDTRKTKIMAIVVPDPSAFTLVDNQLCYYRGTLPTTCHAMQRKNRAESNRSESSSSSSRAHTHADTHAHAQLLRSRSEGGV